MKKRIFVMLAVVLSFATGGCGQGEMVLDTEQELLPEDRVVLKEDHPQYVFEDKDAIYEQDDDTSVITMYLTVSKGNSSENTNHTWEEINSHSVYYYENLGIDRFGVNGLLQIGDENGPQEGQLGYDRYSPNAVVTIRGQSSSEYMRKNYKITLSDGVGTFRNQKTINLNKHEQDGVRFRNKLAYDLMKTIPGMMSLRTQFVHLYVKDLTQGESNKFVDYGLYTQVEQPNKAFLKSRGLDSDGHLYKLNEFEFHRYADVIKLKSDADYDRAAFEKLLEIKGNDDHEKLIAMLEDVNDESISGSDLLNTWFDEENITTWMAFHILMGNEDTQSRNLMIYSPLNLNKWYLISWDCDVNLRWKEEQIRDENWQIGWEKGVANYWGNILFRKLLKDPGFRKKLDLKIEKLHELLSEKRLATMIEKYRGVVKPYVYADADKLDAPLTPNKYDIVCNAMPKEVEENYKFYKNSLKEPLPFYIGTPEIDAKGLHISWDNAYDFNNENIQYSVELADNLEFTNACMKQENLMIPECVFDKKMEPGQYFIRVKAVNQSGNEQYAFDYYVTKQSVKKYGIISIYVMPDGSIEVSSYEE